MRADLDVLRKANPAGGFCFGFCYRMRGFDAGVCAFRLKGQRRQRLPLFSDGVDGVQGGVGRHVFRWSVILVFEVRVLRARPRRREIEDGFGVFQ